MDDIDSSLCKLIQELTYGNIESLREMRNGYLLSNLLNRLDPQFFYMSKKLDNWVNAKSQLEHYLNDKGLENQSLDFDDDAIEEGVLENIISAVLQIIAIYAAFNEKEWLELCAHFEPIQKNLMLPILNPMIDDIVEQKQHLPKKDEMKTLLHRLESQEAELNDLRARASFKENELTLTQKELQKVIAENKKLNLELEDLHRLKNETIKQIEEFYATKDERENELELSRRLDKAVADRDDTADKLFRVQLILADKENEIERLTLLKDAYETKKSDMDNFSEQIQYYKAQNEKLKADIEVKDSKLGALEHADIQISRLREKLKDQNLQLSKMKLEQIESENTIKTLETKLSIANEKIDFIRRRGSSLGEHNSEIAHENGYYIRLEEENARLKRKVEVLIKEISSGDMAGLDEELLERDNQILAGRVKGLMMQAQSMSDYNQLQHDEFNIRSNYHADSTYRSPEKHPTVEQGGLNSALHHFMSDNSLIDDRDDKSENMNLLYSVCIEFLQKEFMKARALTPTYDERSRNIFKQFTLANMIKQPSID